MGEEKLRRVVKCLCVSRNCAAMGDEWVKRVSEDWVSGADDNG